MPLKKNVTFSRCSMLMTIMVMLFVSGCRRPPKNPPKFYQAEIREMERQAAIQAENENQKFLEDRYPWEGKTSNRNCLLNRIYEKEKELNLELDCLHTFVHSKKRNRRRLRD